MRSAASTLLVLRVAALAATLPTLACASLPACPARGGPTWTEWTSTHFVLLTDLDAEDAQATLTDFETLRAAVYVAAWRRAPEPRGRIAVIVLRDWREREVFVRPGYVASFVTNVPLRQSFIVTSGSERNEIVTQTLVLALAHHYGLQGKAHWFDDGLFRYLGKLRVEGDGKMTYGEVDEPLFRALRRGRLTSFEALWNPITLENRDSFEATSWLVVHYLFNREAARMGEFQRQLVTTRDARATWRAVFPDLTPEVMDARLSDYLFLEGQFTAFETRLPPTRFETTSTTLDDAQVHAVRALLYATTSAPFPEPPENLVRAEVAESLRLDPLQIVAILVQRLFLHDDESDIETLKKLIAHRPDNPMAWLLLARARTLRHETEEAAEAWEAVRRISGTAEAPVDLELRVARPD